MKERGGEERHHHKYRCGIAYVARRVSCSVVKPNNLILSIFPTGISLAESPAIVSVFQYVDMLFVIEVTMSRGEGE